MFYRSRVGLAGWWLICCAVVACAALAAWVHLTQRSAGSSFLPAEVILVSPGYVLTLFFGASPHGDKTGAIWRPLVVALASGLVWGTVALLCKIVGRWALSLGRERPAAFPH